MITGEAVRLAMETTPGIILTVVLILSITVMFSKAVRYLLKHYFKASRLLRVSSTGFTVFSHLIVFVIYLIGIGTAIWMVPSLRNLSLSIFAGVGLVAVVLAFASKGSFSNISQGIFIAVFQPFRVGDRIRIGDGGILGKVEDITLRHTVIRTYENKRVIIPNAKISEQTIENYDIGDRRMCKFVELNISYDSDVNKAMKIMREEVEKHPFFLDIRTKEERKKKVPKVKVAVLGYGDFSVKLRAWAWAKDYGDSFVMGNDLNKSIKARFDKNNIEIPYPYRTIVYKKDLKKKRKKHKAK
jgi:small-conductance mechanosensitive channel